MMKDFPYILIGADRLSSFVLSPEHAGNLWPTEYGTPSLPQGWDRTHNASDRGVYDFILKLGEELSCPVLLGKYSRLFIDLNRIPGDKDLIVSTMNDALIPENKIDAEEYQKRLENYYMPYHTALRDLLMDKNRKLVSIHSYTRQRIQDKKPRLWDVGVQYISSTPLVQKFLKEFSSLKNVNIDDNKPYDLRECAPSVLSLHATPFNRDAVELEFCDDQLFNKDACSFWFNETKKILL